MKIKRFLSVFLLCACLTGLFLTPAVSALDIPDIQAKAALLVDVNTDAVAYAKNIHEKNYPASLTKVMTALLILEKVSGDETLLNTQVTAPESAFSDLLPRRRQHRRHQGRRGPDGKGAAAMYADRLRQRSLQHSG